MTTTEPTTENAVVTALTATLGTKELREEADEILDALDQASCDLMETLYRAQALDKQVDQLLNEVCGQFTTVIAEDEHLSDNNIGSDAIDGINTVVRALSGGSSVWIALSDLSKLCHPELVFSGRPNPQAFADEAKDRLGIDLLDERPT